MTSHIRAKALNGVGYLAMFQGDYEAAKVRLEESLVLYRQLDDEKGIAYCLIHLGLLAVMGQRDDLSAETLLEEAMEIEPRLKDRRALADLTFLAGIVSLISRRNVEEGWAEHDKALALFREVGDVRGVVLCLSSLGLMSIVRRDNAQARTLLRELVILARESGDRLASLYSFFELACVAALEGQTYRAVRLWGASEAVRESSGIELHPSTRSFVGYEGRLAAARDQLGDAEFERAWTVGKSMTQESAVNYALEEGNPPPAGPPEPAGKRQPAALTRREEEVAALVARGLTNSHIASELSISERTVDTHVGRILGKFGAHTRDEVATQIAR